MNPTRAVAVWLVEQLPASAPDSVVGVTVLLGIFLVMLAALGVAGLVMCIVERKGNL
ncbi:hypothetical protein [Aidingimonas halophila]|uniref:Uncharacterized protein n=1 Tax=Aidingimonas halophila TaxID=574349 RepID=A0A1H2RG85_9GAMM|nr:hypothetical protein [Aidingimonas halophila]GHC19277.1 hypothetical protein GCM10008094_06570 [Aidingimonas halophila]SDW18397.1 hypothetical protein SAMN05443545_101315 [Aidingimonas halophila]